MQKVYERTKSISWKPVLCGKCKKPLGLKGQMPAVRDEERELISNKLELFILQQKLPAYLV